MADREYLEERLAKAREKVEKCKGTIARHEKALEKKLALLVKKESKINLSNLDEFKWNKGGGGSVLYWEICDIESKQSDIKGAKVALENAEEIASGWEKKLNMEIERIRFIEGNAPEVIKKFLEQWKEKSYEWHIKRLAGYREMMAQLEKEEAEARADFVKSHPEEYGRYLDEKGEIREYYSGRHGLHDVWPSKPLEEHLKSLELDYKSIQARLMNFAGMMVIRMHQFYNDEEAKVWLAKQLEEERKRKMVDLIYRINDEVGPIEDAENLKIDARANLNGRVRGEKGWAKVETVGAGGWNIQCFHFRTLVHKIK